MNKIRKQATPNSGLLTAAVLSIVFSNPTAAQQSDQQLLDEYLTEIERLISANNLEGARSKLAEATSANLEDESLEMINSQLRLLESLNSNNFSSAQRVAVRSGDGATSLSIGQAASQANNQPTDQRVELTDQDKLAAMDLLDSLRVAMENGELNRVKLFTDPTPQTDSLLSAVFANYSSLRVKVSEPEPENETQSFLATLEFTQLTTKDGNTAFPAQAWKTHRLRIVKSDGKWQTVLW